MPLHFLTSTLISLFFSPSFKRFATLTVLFLALVTAYRRVQRNRRFVPPTRTNLRSLTHSAFQPSNSQTPNEKYFTQTQNALRKVVVINTQCLIKNGQVSEHDARALLKLAKNCKLYLITRLKDDKDLNENQSLPLLRSIGLTETLFPFHHHLVCTTSKGESAIERHLEPDLVATENKQVVELIRPYIGDVLYITNDLKEEEFTKLPILKASQQVVIQGVTQSNPSNKYFIIKSLADFFQTRILSESIVVEHESASGLKIDEEKID